MLTQGLLVIAAAFPGFGLAASQDYGDADRNPYSFQYNVADQETFNHFKVEEKGDPTKVEGSYRIALPDGRMQVVTYKVLPDDGGYDAKVTYEGEAQYPDTPQGYKATPYGPPEPVRGGQAIKFKRQLNLPNLDEQVRVSSNRVPKQIKESDKPVPQKELFKVSSKVGNIKSRFDLLVAPSDQVEVKERRKKFVIANKARTPIKQKKKVADKKQKAETKKSDSYDEPQHEPQAEPLSLRQSPPKVNRPETKRKTVDDEQVTRVQPPVTVAPSTTSPQTTTTEHEPEAVSTTVTTKESITSTTESAVINWQEQESEIVIKNDIAVPNVIEFDLFNEVFDQLEESKKPKRNIYTYKVNKDLPVKNTFQIMNPTEGHINEDQELFIETEVKHQEEKSDPITPEPIQIVHNVEVKTPHYVTPQPVASVYNYELKNGNVVTPRVERNAYNYQTRFAERTTSTPVYRSKISWGEVVPYQPYYRTTVAPRSLPNIQFSSPIREVSNFPETLILAESQREYSGGVKKGSNPKIEYFPPEVASVPSRPVHIPAFLEQPFQVETSSSEKSGSQQIEDNGKVEIVDYIEDYDSFPFGSRLPAVIVPQNNIIDRESQDAKKTEEEPTQEPQKLERDIYAIRVPRKVESIIVSSKAEKVQPKVEPIHHGSNPVKLIFTGETYVPEIVPKY